MNEETETKEEKPVAVWPPIESSASSSPQPHVNMPVPTTPQGAPVNQSFEYELPFELQQQGNVYF